jgi:hypothetical protein
MGSWDENYGGNYQQNGPNIALSLSSARSVRFYYDHKTHFITDNVRGTAYTVPGSFNSELGCAGDWSPNCLGDADERRGRRRHLHLRHERRPGRQLRVQGSPPASRGTTTGRPATRRSPSPRRRDRDRLLHPPAATQSPSVDGGTGTEPGRRRARAGQPAQGPDKENFYFVMADRFADGDGTNNEGGLTGGRLDTGYDPTDKGFYHGGDLAGLKEKLDYIEGLGTTAIWMTPSFKNKPVQGDGAGEVSAAYHGYWITDFTQIDPHLGTNASSRRSSTRRTPAGIKVFFDIITNHTADVIKYGENEYAYRSKAAYPYVARRASRSTTATSRARTASRRSTRRRASPTSPRHPRGERPQVPEWLNDPTLYHNRGDTTFVGEDSLYGDFFGLDDLFTEHPRVVRGMIDIYKAWIKDFGHRRLPHRHDEARRRRVLGSSSDPRSWSSPGAGG